MIRKEIRGLPAAYRKPKHSDEEVLQEIKEEIKKSTFNAEGYLKVKNRMGKRKINALVAGKARVNRINIPQAHGRSS